ncbi:MAG: tail fiber domain-containing protein, partial [Saprospiraceae bacterium]|nr:tail fiber domain-containing protein [Saprospiraceae bacterium]
IMRITNTSTNTDADGVRIQVGPTSNPPSTNKFIAFRDGDGTLIGQITGNGSGGTIYNTTSDRRLKQNITPYTKGLDLIQQIYPRQFEMISAPGQVEIGFIAQELYEIMPQIVSGTPGNPIDDPMMVDYSKVTPVLVSAVKEQQSLIEEQSKLIADLLSRIEKLEGQTQGSR